MDAQEINFDGLVGPTHNYAGLSQGNIASALNEGQIARPRQAALEGLNKMRGFMSLGLAQGVLPPHERPDIQWLRGLGFQGDDHAVWERAWTETPHIARAAAAVSSMWAANAATASPSMDCSDGRLHLSVANLNTMLHRAMEAETTERALRRIFSDETMACVHPPLPQHPLFSDEGAANHMRLSAGRGMQGLEIFVYGRADDRQGAGFPARQTLEACQAIARRHGLDPARTIFTRQSAKAIQAGAFHNDVVAAAHENVLLYHAEAFADLDGLKREIRAKAKGLFEPLFVEIGADEMSLADAVKTYFFNAQLLRFPRAATMTLIAPREVRENNAAADIAASLPARSQGLIGAPMYVELRQSMRNGGGPACLRLRVELNGGEREAANPGFMLTKTLADALEDWINAHYREELAPADLSDPALVDEVRAALDALTAILPLGGDFYPFQRR